jgi:hypothetical protein
LFVLSSKEHGTEKGGKWGGRRLRDDERAKDLPATENRQDKHRRLNSSAKSFSLSGICFIHDPAWADDSSLRRSGVWP